MNTETQVNKSKVFYRNSSKESFPSVGCFSTCNLPGLRAAISYAKIVITGDTDSGYMRAFPFRCMLDFQLLYSYTNKTPQVLPHCNRN